MSATVERVPLAAAQHLAEQLRDLLAPGCSRIEIAGSIRRRADTVGDIEILCMPRVEHVASADLFGQRYDEVNCLTDRLAYLKETGALADRLDKLGRPAWGERFVRAEFRGMAADIFMVLPPAQWGVLLAIRTGPADYSHRLVTLKPHGGLCPAWLHVKDGALQHIKTGEVIETPEEADFFAALGVPYADPRRRS